MFEIKLVVHEIAKDGLPKESMKHVLAFYGYGYMDAPFSRKHGKFNCHDSDSDETAEKFAFDNDVTHWIDPADMFRLLGAGEKQ